MSKVLEVLQHLFQPIRFMILSATYLPITVFRLVISRQISTLASPRAFKDAWFAEFWRAFGPTVREMAIPNVEPLLAQCRGVVLDIGPGSGEWLKLFPKEGISKIYGVEPNTDHHELLRKRIKEAGLSDVYVILPVGVLDLGEESVRKGEVDTVVTIQCLCSVGEPKEVIQFLEGYIRKGGQWFVYEHVVTHVGGLVGLYQSLIDIFWPHFLGGCSITRDTEKWLRESGDWSKVDLKQPDGEPSYQVIPFVMGVLTK